MVYLLAIVVTDNVTRITRTTLRIHENKTQDLGLLAAELSKGKLGLKCA